VGAQTHRVEVRYSFDLLIVVSTGQLGQALWVQFATVREELSPILLGQLCAERVDGDDEGPAVCLKLERETHRHIETQTHRDTDTDSVYVCE